MNSGKVVLGVLAGVAIGATLGILFAPAKGTETRKKILREGEDAIGEINDKFEELLNRITEKIDTVKEEIIKH
jgi:gas vesicle protein